MAFNVHNMLHSNLCNQPMTHLANHAALPVTQSVDYANC